MICYLAAWTDSGCLRGCDHEHQTVPEAVACISCAGGYVIAVENKVFRALNDAEEAEFQSAPRLVPELAKLEYEKSGYALMIRVCFVDGWGWDTWMRYETYEEAAVYARDGNKIVTFGSADWYALRQIREPALPSPAHVRQESHSRCDEETLLDFVSRVVPAPVDPRSLRVRTTTKVSSSPVHATAKDKPKTFIEFVLDRLDEWELKALQGIHSVLILATAAASVSRRQVRKAIRRKIRT